MPAVAAAAGRPIDPYDRPPPLPERVYLPCPPLPFIITSITRAPTPPPPPITIITTNGRCPAVAAVPRPSLSTAAVPRPPVAVVVAAAAVAAVVVPGICIFAKRNTLALIVGAVSLRKGIYRFTSAFIPAKSLTFAPFAEKDFLKVER